MAEHQEHKPEAADTDIMSSSSNSHLSITSVEGAVGGEPQLKTMPMDKDDTNMGGASTNSQLDGVDRLLQKHRSEIMFELRRLRHGDRPVTGQENRKNVEDFFARMTAPEGAVGGNLPDEHRPESVVVEVQGLVQRRPVSSMLQSPAFRRSLENVFRGSLAAAIGRSSPRVNRRQTPARPNIVQPNVSSLLASSPPPPPPLPQEAGIINVEAEPFQASNTEEHRQLPSAPLPPQPSPLRTQAWLQEHQANIDPREQHQISVWDSMEQTTRENIIMDISELVQQQLVTATLEGQFRNTLESHITRRIQSTGLDGQRTASFVRNIPQSQPHRRNDFSDLGIMGPQGAMGPSSDNLDEISVISATAAVRVNNTQQNAYVNHEIRSLKSQMNELKQMMKLSFDLQLDIQRSIRQEVAAALSQALGTATEAPVVPAQPVHDSHCIICLEGHADSVLYQCGHMCLCYTCAKTLQNGSGHCPMCRAPIQDVIRAYKASDGDME